LCRWRLIRDHYSIVPKTIAEVDAIQAHVLLVASQQTVLVESATYVLHQSKNRNQILTGYYSGTVLAVATIPVVVLRADGAARQTITAAPVTSPRTTHLQPLVINKVSPRACTQLSYPSALACHTLIRTPATMDHASAQDLMEKYPKRLGTTSATTLRIPRLSHQQLQRQGKSQ
jgi:hypothetical protein